MADARSNQHDIPCVEPNVRTLTRRTEPAAPAHDDVDMGLGKRIDFESPGRHQLRVGDVSRPRLRYREHVCQDVHGPLQRITRLGVAWLRPSSFCDSGRVSAAPKRKTA